MEARSRGGLTGHEATSSPLPRGECVPRHLRLLIVREKEASKDQRQLFNDLANGTYFPTSVRATAADNHRRREYDGTELAPPPAAHAVGGGVSHNRTRVPRPRDGDTSSPPCTGPHLLQRHPTETAS